MALFLLKILSKNNGNERDDMDDEFLKSCFLEKNIKGNIKIIKHQKENL